MRWQRVLEGVIVSLLLLVAAVTFGDPQTTLSILGTVDPLTYALAVASTVGGVLIWSETLASLLGAQGEELTPGRFQVSFLAGMGLRSLVPGGSTSGPVVLAYVVSRANGVAAETSVAMSYVLEVFLWIGTVVVGFSGFGLLVLVTDLSMVERRLAAGLIAFTAVVFAVLLYGIEHPEPVESRIEWVVKTLHNLAQGHSSLLADHLDAEVVDERLDRFFSAFRYLGHDPKHLVPGLIAAVAGWFVHALTLYLVFVSLGIHVPLAIPFVVVPTAGLSEGLSMLPGGIGVFEPSFVALLLLLTPIGVPAATSVVILYRLSNYWFRIGLGFACVSVLALTDMFQGSVANAVSKA